MELDHDLRGPLRDKDRQSLMSLAASLGLPLEQATYLISKAAIAGYVNGAQDMKTPEPDLKATDADFNAWCGRHGLDPDRADNRAMFEDAASIYLTKRG